MFVKPISGFPDIPFSFELRLRKGGLSQRYRTLGPESVVVFLSLREHCVEGENRAPGHKEERLGAGFFGLVPFVPRPQQYPWMVLDEGFDGFSILLKCVPIFLCVL